MTNTGYRHNILNISSIDSFLNIRGGLNKNIRDVYFVCAVGEPENVNEMLSEIDSFMMYDSSRNYVQYARISTLPNLVNFDDSVLYGKLYDDLMSGRIPGFQRIRSDDILNSQLAESLEEIMRIYSSSRSMLSDSIKRNLGTKILFWLDQTADRILINWNQRSCIKVIADNVQKEHEYLYYLFLTLLGCDVLLMETHKDLVLKPELMKYLHKIDIGSPGDTIIKPFMEDREDASISQEENSVLQTVSEESHPEETETAMTLEVPQTEETETKSELPVEEVQTEEHTEEHTAASPPQHIRQTIPRPIYTAAAAKPTEEKTYIPDISMNIPQRPEKDEPRKEKSYEELAQLASSVVLIGVHDKTGRVIASGSGIMIGRDGFVLTNFHVVERGLFFSVRIENEEKQYISNEIIKYNQATDLAVLRIQRKLQPIPIYRESAELVRGQKVIAIGSPLGLFNSVSDGIISGFRQIDDNEMIQFTAPISHGSSGGAVLNTYGELIGISTAGIDSGQNLNLAVSYKDILLFAGGFINSR